MPKGIYPRNQAKAVANEVKKLAAKSKKQKRTNTFLSVTVLSSDQDGVRVSKHKVKGYFAVFQVIFEQYLQVGVSILEVRIGRV